MLTHRRLIEVADYNPKTGLFIRRSKSGRKGKIGAVMGCKSKGPSAYTRIRIDGVLYLGHRLAWFYVYGAWPEDELDHRDQDRYNNRLDNLRPATRHYNSLNQGIRSDNKSGYKGVVWLKQKKRWRASATLNGTTHYLGTYRSARDAGAAYKAFVLEHHGEFANDNLSRRV